MSLPFLSPGDAGHSELLSVPHPTVPGSGAILKLVALGVLLCLLKHSCQYIITPHQGFRFLQGI